MADSRPAVVGQPTDRVEAFLRLADDHLDAAYRLARAILHESSDAQDPTHDALEQAWRKWRRSGLSPDHRLVVVLRYYRDLPLGEIADRLGIPVGTAPALRAQASPRGDRGRRWQGNHPMTDEQLEKRLRDWYRNEIHQWQLHVMSVPLDGSEPRALHEAGICYCIGGAPSLTWSPDGTSLAFVGFESDSFSGGLTVMAADRTGLRRLTDDGDRPAWQPLP